MMIKNILITTFVALIACACSDNKVKLEDYYRGVKKETITIKSADKRFGNVSPGDTLFVIVNYFDEEGKNTRREIYDEDGLNRRFDYEYVGNTTILWKYTEMGILSSSTKSEYKYDDNNRLISYKDYSLHDELWEESNYTYDDKGNEVRNESVRYDSGKPYTDLRTSYYEYDSKGRITRRTEISHDSFSAEPDTTITTYEYTKNKLSKTVEESPSFLTIKEYDKNGNITRDVSAYKKAENYSREEAIKRIGNTYEYKYDREGRVISHIELTDGVPEEYYYYEYEMY